MNAQQQNVRVTPSMKNGAKEDIWLKTTCYGCPAGTCGMIAHRVNGLVTEVKGDPDCPFSQGRLCAKGHAQIMMAYSPKRLTKPLKRTNPEKGIGVDPRWVEISYDEAIRIAGEKLKQCHEKDPTGMVVGYTDFSTFPWFIGSMLVSFGSPNLVTAGKSFCGNNVHPILQQVHGGFHAGPDFHHSNYVMLFGSNKGAMSNWAAVTSTLEMSQARSRGMKVVVVDPWCSNSAAVADEWVPLRPGTDGALLLCMINLLINEYGLYDEPFLKKMSNGPYLIRNSDGHYVRDRDTNKPMIWDNSDNKPKCFDDATLVDPAMDGSFEVTGQGCMPAFKLLKEHMAKYTPGRVSEITTVPAANIRRIAREFGTAASIGSTIEIDGKILPLRPACAHWYKGLSQHVSGYEAGVAIGMLNTIVGAIDVPGGLSADSVYIHHPLYSAFSTWMGKEAEMREIDGLVVPGKNATYADNFPAPNPPRPIAPPVNMGADSLVPAGLYMGQLFSTLNVINPGKFKNKIPHNAAVYVQIVSNEMMNEGNPAVQAEYHKKFAFQISIVPQVDETAEFADIVIPAQSQLERLDLGANNIPDTMGSTATGEYCINLRQPVVDTDRKHFVEVWMDLAEKVGVLPAFNQTVNYLMELQGEFSLSDQQKYTQRGLTERWVGSMTGGNLTLEDVAKDGHISWKKSVKERYPRAFYTPRIPVYYEHVLEAGEKVKATTAAMGIEWDVSRYKPMPDWVPGSGYNNKNVEFELYAVTFKWPFLTSTFSNFNPWLGELRQYHPYTGKLVLNRKFANSKGIQDGDRVKLENVGGRVVEGIAMLSECIHPECVGMDHSAGSWAKILPPRSKSTGTHASALIDYDMKNLDIMAGTFDSSPKLKVSRIG